VARFCHQIDHRLRNQSYLLIMLNVAFHSYGFYSLIVASGQCLVGIDLW